MQPTSQSDYKQLLTDVIKKQIVILGPDITLSKARNVKGLTVGDDGTVTAVTGNPQEIIQALIDQFVQLSGLIVKKTMEPLLTLSEPESAPAAAPIPAPPAPTPTPVAPTPTPVAPAVPEQPAVPAAPVATPVQPIAPTTPEPTPAPAAAPAPTVAQPPAPAPVPAAPTVPTTPPAQPIPAKNPLAA